MAVCEIFKKNNVSDLLHFLNVKLKVVTKNRVFIYHSFSIRKKDSLQYVEILILV